MAVTPIAGSFEGLFARASALAPVHQRSFRFAGRSVQTRIAGAELGEATVRPFAHLLADPADIEEPELLIELCDGAATGAAAPVEPQAGKGSVTVDGDFVTHVMPGACTRIDRLAGRVVGWRADGNAIPLEDLTKPLPVVLPLWYFDRGVNVIHAGLVSRDGAGALVGGDEGSGKSTTALACAAAGFAFLGDDRVGLEEAAPREFVGHSLYSTARLEPGALAARPGLLSGVPTITSPKEEKAVLFLAEAPGVRLERLACVKIIVLPRRGRTRRSGLRPATPTEALLAMAPTSLVAVAGGGARGFERLARLVEHVPAHWLDLGDDPTTAPDLVQRALDLAR